MSWLALEGDDFAQVLASRPALQEKFAAFMQAVEGNDSVPDSVLALCRARIRQIHGQAADGVTQAQALRLAPGVFGDFSAAEQAALNLAERIPFQHHQIEDAEIDAAKSEFGDAGCVTLLTALSFFDVTCRINATLGLGGN